MEKLYNNIIKVGTYKNIILTNAHTCHILTPTALFVTTCKFPIFKWNEQMPHSGTLFNINALWRHRWCLLYRVAVPHTGSFPSRRRRPSNKYSSKVADSGGSLQIIIILQRPFYVLTIRNCATELRIGWTPSMPWPLDENNYFIIIYHINWEAREGENKLAIKCSQTLLLP